jgi:hypothetical protein
MITSGREMCIMKRCLPPFSKTLLSSTQSILHVLIISMITWVLIVLLFPCSATAQSTNKVVTVTGLGSTPNEARNDAVRQALQETMQQLIVVDRAIKDDQITRDKIMSTMNGYIENFRELSVQKEGQQIAVKAEITVSPSRIENFIGTSIGGGGSISGAAMSAESQREIAQRQARGEIFDRLFRGFPSEVMEVKLEKIKPNDKDPEIYDLDVTTSFSKSWIDALKTGLSALRIGSINIPSRNFSYRVSRTQIDLMDTYKFNNDNIMRIKGAWRKEDVVCLAENNNVECSVLPMGSYGSDITGSIIKQKVIPRGCQRSFQSEPFSVVKIEPPCPHDGLISTPSFPTFPRSL